MLVADRMASVGRLAPGLAHDLSNPLTSLLAVLEAIEEELRDLRGGPPNKLEVLLELVDSARDASRRIREILHGLNAFSRVEPPSRSAAPGEHHADPLHPLPTPRSRLRVLIVDDEPAMVQVIARALREDYDVATASSGKRALELTLESPFDIIISDVMMPEMSGVELHDLLMERSPEQAKRILFITGGVSDPVLDAALRALPNHRLEKPFALEDLMSLLQSRALTAATEPRPA